MFPRAKTAKEHQTTLRFSTEMWRQLTDAAAALDVSVAQYVRDAARTRLEHESRVAPVARGVREQADMAKDESLRHAESSAALWEQGRLARQRAQALREEARARRDRGNARRSPVPVPGPAIGPWEASRLARERRALDQDPGRSRPPER